MCMRRPKVNVTCLPVLLSAVCLKAGSLTELEAVVPDLLAGHKPPIPRICPSSAPCFPALRSWVSGLLPLCLVFMWLLEIRTPALELT